VSKRNRDRSGHGDTSDRQKEIKREQRDKKHVPKERQIEDEKSEKRRNTVRAELNTV
jgi:hypothetical protein